MSDDIEKADPNFEKAIEKLTGKRPENLADEELHKAVVTVMFNHSEDCLNQLASHERSKLQAEPTAMLFKYVTLAIQSNPMDHLLGTEAVLKAVADLLRERRRYTLLNEVEAGLGQ